MRSSLIFCLVMCLPVDGLSDDPRPWSPDQATGAPDSPLAGDQRTAWAALTADGGREWLKLEFEKSVSIESVRIYESFNPGAITRVSAYTTPTAGKILWEGEAELGQAPHIFEIEPEEEVIANNITLLFDTTRVAGWNEIDAVELIGKDGSRQWAVKATASTTYASLFELPILTYEALPPVVTLTKPAAGTLDVDAAKTKEIRVTFSKDMLKDTEMKLMPVSQATFPKPTGEIKFMEDNRTFIIPVKLEPGRTYVLWLNDGNFNPFRDEAGTAALPYQLVFRTK